MLSAKSAARSPGGAVLDAGVVVVVVGLVLAIVYLILIAMALRWTYRTVRARSRRP
jgi:hypothetical protein